jgi:spore coat protein U-like protein
MSIGVSLSPSAPRRVPCWALVLLAAFLSFALPGKAHALSCSATITDVDFGNPSLFSSGHTDALATVTVTCTSIPFLSVVKMCPGIGDGSGGSNGSARLMTGPGVTTLTYQLFQDSSRTQGWGAVDEPQLGTVPVMTLGNGFTGAGTATATIYARLFGSQSTAPPGAYTSAFAGAETAFSYSLYFVGSSASCTGFVGSYVVRPEFDVSARPPAGCSATTTDLAFPAAGVLTSALRAESSVRVTCTSKTSYSIALDNGTSGSSPTARKMTSASGDTVTYGLYRDSARSRPWGGASLAVTGAGTGTAQAIPIYGLVPAQSTPRPGDFSDRVIVTITY